MAAVSTNKVEPAHSVDIMSHIVPPCQHLHVPFQKLHSQVFEVFTKRHSKQAPMPLYLATKSRYEHKYSTVTESGSKLSQQYSEHHALFMMSFDIYSYNLHKME
jgi:hypothetical protein